MFPQQNPLEKLIYEGFSANSCPKSWGYGSEQDTAIWDQHSSREAEIKRTHE